MRVGYLAERLGGFPEKMPFTTSSLMNNSGHNIGNFAFWTSGAALFSGDPILVPFNAQPEAFESALDVLLIPAANWLNARQDFSWLADFIRELDIPVVILGLGAQATDESERQKLPEGTVQFLKEASKRTPYIGVRGAYTQSLCHHYGIHNVKVMGCPSILLNEDKNLGSKIAQAWNKIPGRVVHHASTTKPRARSVERAIFQRVRSSPFHSYVVQAPREWFRVLLSEYRSGDSQQAEALHRYFDPQSSRESFEAVVRANSHVPFSTSAWMHELKTCTHTVNTRIHGTIVSLMSETPAVCITHDTRTRELCETLLVPQINVSEMEGIDVMDVFSKVTMNAEDFEENRRNLAGVHASLLSEVGLELSPKLKEWTA